MTQALTPRRYIVVVALAIAFEAIFCAVLPYDDYIHYQVVSYDSDYTVPLRWIYERIHFDPAPIDNVFIGTSHTQSGINSDVVDNQARIHGRTMHTVNFAIPFLGRDIEYLIVKELFSVRKIKNLVIELQEDEPIYGHPTFNRLASFADLVEAPLSVDLGLFKNFLSFPARNLELFIKSADPRLFSLQDRFRPEQYAGPYWDDTYRMHTLNGFQAPRTGTHDDKFFTPYVSALSKDEIYWHRLAKWLAIFPTKYNLLYRYNLVFLDRIVAEAQMHGAEVTFLYLPSYKGASIPYNEPYIKQFGKILVPGEILSDVSLWQNVGHFNAQGAAELSRWVSDTGGL